MKIIKIILFLKSLLISCTALKGLEVLDGFKIRTSSTSNSLFNLLTSDSSKALFNNENLKDSNFYSDALKSCCFVYDGTIKCMLIAQTAPCLNLINKKFLNKKFNVTVADLSENRLLNLRKGKLLPEQEYQIQELNLSNNNIDTIEDGTFDFFSTLRVLNLTKNNLQIINDRVLTKKLGLTLENLELNWNGLLSLPSLRYLSNLKQLFLNHNLNMNVSTYTFPKTMSNLKVLSMAFCKITSLNENIFINLKNLEELYINGNPFLSIPRAINVLSNLKLLSVTETQIRTVEECDFCGLSNLKELMLDKNTNLSSINENAFGFLNDSTAVKLRMLSISYTNISILPESLLDWKNIEYISIEALPLACDCSMKWFITDLTCKGCSIYARKIRGVKSQIIKRIPLCYYPLKLRWIPLHSISRLKPDFC